MGFLLTRCWHLLICCGTLQFMLLWWFLTCLVVCEQEDDGRGRAELREVPELGSPGPAAGQVLRPRAAAPPPPPALSGDISSLSRRFLIRGSAVIRGQVPAMGWGVHTRHGRGEGPGNGRPPGKRAPAEPGVAWSEGRVGGTAGAWLCTREEACSGLALERPRARMWGHGEGHPSGQRLP